MYPEEPEREEEPESEQSSTSSVLHSVSNVCRGTWTRKRLEK